MVSADVGDRPVVPPFGPLAGVRVVDSARFVAGPWAATYLGEFGAEVVHVEGPPFAPPYADATRLLPPLLPEGASAADGVSESWVQYSRNKLSLGLDLRQPDGRATFLDLLRRSDIWIESSRPGTYDRLGLSDREAWEANPKLVIVHVSGFGQTGDPSRVAGPSFDLIGQAFSGYLALQGRPDPEPPMRAGTAMNDTVTGLAAAAAALMAYVHAGRTGRGQSVDVAQYEMFFVLLENLALDYFVRGVVRGRHGTGHSRLFPYDVHAAKDGWVVVAAPTQATWERLLEMIGPFPSEWTPPAYRADHQDEVRRRLDQFCWEHTASELEALGRRHDVAVSKVYDIAAIAADPHYRARGMFEEWTDPVAGRVKGAGIAPKFSATPGRVWRGAPWLGQDNDAVLSTVLGYSASKILDLRGRGIIGESRPPTRDPAGRPPPFFLRGGL
ncbi:MAG: CoA transferase [Thermoplasmata archaeon]|nr:CoA transferase [Thermoplasmata archaeon]